MTPPPASFFPARRAAPAWLPAAVAACLLLAFSGVARAEEQPAVPLASTKAPEIVHSAAQAPTESKASEPVAAATKENNSHPPRAIHTVAPTHPPELRRKLIGGECEIECLVSEAGKVVYTKVLSSTQPEFGQAAEAAVRQWEFRPAERDGQPIAMNVRVPFSFSFTAAEVLEIVAGRPVFVAVTGTLIPAEQLPTWPMPTRIYQPPYPPVLRGSGKHGKAVVSIVVDKTGHVINPKIVKSTYPEFNMPALATAVRLVYPPQIVGNRNQEAINISMDIEFEFHDPDVRKQPDAGGKPEAKPPVAKPD